MKWSKIKKATRHEYLMTAEEYQRYRLEKEEDRKRSKEIYDRKQTLVALGLELYY